MSNTDDMGISPKFCAAAPKSSSDTHSDTPTADTWHWIHNKPYMLPEEVSSKSYYWILLSHLNTQKMKVRPPHVKVQSLSCRWDLAFGQRNFIVGF